MKRKYRFRYINLSLFILIFSIIGFAVLLKYPDLPARGGRRPTDADKVKGLFVTGSLILMGAIFYYREIQLIRRFYSQQKVSLVYKMFVKTDLIYELGPLSIKDDVLLELKFRKIIPENRKEAKLVISDEIDNISKNKKGFSLREYGQKKNHMTIIKELDAPKFRLRIEIQSKSPWQAELEMLAIAYSKSSELMLPDITIKENI